MVIENEYPGRNICQSERQLSMKRFVAFCPAEGPALEPGAGPRLNLSQDRLDRLLHRHGLSRCPVRG